MTLHPFSVLMSLLTSTPLDPDSDEASNWLVEELAKNEYQAAQPTLWDRMVQAFWEWLGSLFSDVPGAPVDPTGFIVVAVLVVAGIVLAILIGRPAAARRSAVAARRLFLEDDTRTALELRRASETAARSRDWALAVTERYRAIARDLGDRTLIAVLPGSTAHDVARRAAVPFPAEAEAFARAASDFDDVRYLDRAGSEGAWAHTRDLDDRVARARPASIGELDRTHA